MGFKINWKAIVAILAIIVVFISRGQIFFENDIVRLIIGISIIILMFIYMIKKNKRIK
jgi:hypothetical protein